METPAEQTPEVQPPGRKPWTAPKLERLDVDGSEKFPSAVEGRTPTNMGTSSFGPS